METTRESWTASDDTDNHGYLGCSLPHILLPCQLIVINTIYVSVVVSLVLRWTLVERDYLPFFLFIIEHRWRWTSCKKREILSYVLLKISLRLGSWDSLLVRAPDSWSKGCQFESRQERRENFLLQSWLCVLTLIRCPLYRSVIRCPFYRSGT